MTCSCHDPREEAIRIRIRYLFVFTHIFTNLPLTFAKHSDSSIQ